MCFSFVPLTWFFGVETSGRTLEEIDTLVGCERTILVTELIVVQFAEHPRALMSRVPEANRVIRSSKADGERRLQQIGEKRNSISHSQVEEKEAI